jgi:hypothetical protein
VCTRLLIKYFIFHTSTQLIRHWNELYRINKGLLCLKVCKPVCIAGNQDLKASKSGNDSNYYYGRCIRD